MKILDSEVIAACTRTPMKVLSCSQKDNTCPSTPYKFDTSEITPKTSWGTTQTSDIALIQQTDSDLEMKALRHRAVVHILLILSMLTL